MEVPGRGRKSAGRPASTRIGASRWLDVARFATPVDDDVADGRMAAMARVAWAPTETRWPAQLDLARFLIAHDLGAEAMGVLLDGPGEGQDDDARHALLGAADFLLGRHGVAAAALARAALDGDPEIALWRAATAAEHEDWELAEVVLESAHGAADDTLTTYPLRLQLRLGLPIARVHARAGRAMEAFAVLDRLAGTQLATSDRRRVEFTRGLVYRDIGAIDAADRTWRALEQGVRDRTRLEVALARRMMLVDAGRMPAKVALRELDSLRPAWRGHPEEARQLDALAGLHASAGQIGQAIRLWQEALVRGVDPQLAEAIERSQRGALVEALLESGDAWVGPLRAYRLYQDFRQLLPDGREGMEIRQQLAARLATIDQIDPAAELLQDALGMHPEGVHRAELGAELAALWLDYPDPVRALRALKESAALNLPPALARERALLLARAALAVDDYGTAREAIASYDDREAARLRAEILWVAKDWDGLQTTLGPLVGAHQPSPDLPPDERRRLLVKLALANLAAGDRAALGPLQQTHQELVDGTAEEAQFGLVTALADTPTQPIAIIDAAGRKIGAVRDFLSGL